MASSFRPKPANAFSSARTRHIAFVFNKVDLYPRDVWMESLHYHRQVLAQVIDEHPGLLSIHPTSCVGRQRHNNGLQPYSLATARRQKLGKLVWQVALLDRPYRALEIVLHANDLGLYFAVFEP